MDTQAAKEGTRVAHATADAHKAEAARLANRLAQVLSVVNWPCKRARLLPSMLPVEVASRAPPTFAQRLC